MILQENRSMPEATVIPELPYPDIRDAVNWLTRCFSFFERLRIGDHRSQLVFGEGSIIATGQGDDSASSSSVLVRVRDIDGHFTRAKEQGVQILNPPTDFPYGERQYVAEDLAGHRWTFSETIRDVDPQEWGGTLADRQSAP